jgi:hypothetical protein
MKRTQLFLVVGFAVAAAFGAIWFLPIQGQVIVTTGNAAQTMVFPQTRLEPHGQAADLLIADNVAWSNVGLGVNGKLFPAADWQANPNRVVTWRWELASNDLNGELVFYHSCQTGCVERTRLMLGKANSIVEANQWNPTKLGVVSANPNRDWHGRSGWDVEMTYSTLAEDKESGIDELARHVYRADAQHLRVLVRVDYAPGQTLPPANDNVALSQYLNYARRLARDARLRSVYGYIIGSGFNDPASNSPAPNVLVTPEWYARIFNGYGEEVTRTDNIIQVIHQENPQARVLVGPVRPFKMQQDGTTKYAIDAPWLNYMNTLVALLDETARAKMQAGFALTAPDGFAVNAPGRPNAPELEGHAAADEPRTDLKRAAWNGAQAGFRVYRDWLDIINAYPTTRGLPVYINATNTFSPDEGIVPAQNYPRGWLTSAYQVINSEPQVQSLIWFLDEDQSADGRWDAYSLTKGIGRVYDAAKEFDELLQR